MAEQKIQDDITIILQAQKSVVHETVRINVAIQAQVDPERSETDFRKEIHSTLRKFIPGDWKIQNIQRQKGNQFESVHVNATVRVLDKENYQLEARAQKVSRIGFELVGPRPEYELTFDEIQTVNQGLRLMLITQALVECTAYNDTFKKTGYSGSRYRISSTRFDTGTIDKNANRAFNNVFIAASTASPGPMGGAMPTIHQIPYQNETEDAVSGCEDEGTADIGVTTRFSMTGTFVLRSVHA